MISTVFSINPMYSRASCVVEVELIIISPFIDVSLDVPDVLDISHLKGNGLQPGEEELPVADDSQSKQGFQIKILFSKQIVELLKSEMMYLMFL